MKRLRRLFGCASPPEVKYAHDSGGGAGATSGEL
jgi:hypothetical protein